MARRNKRASMREGPLADLFRSTSEDAPRYGREDPAEAKRAEEEAAPVEQAPAAEEPAPEPRARPRAARPRRAGRRRAPRGA